MTTQIPQRDGRTERVLAYLVAAAVGLSLLAFVAVIIGTVAGVGPNDGFSQGAWPFVITFPLFGLPIGFILIISLLILTGGRRRREARQSGQ